MCLFMAAGYSGYAADTWYSDGTVDGNRTCDGGIQYIHDSCAKDGNTIVTPGSIGDVRSFA
jgi:hypothetical protein